MAVRTLEFTTCSALIRAVHRSLRLEKVVLVQCTQESTNELRLTRVDPRLDVDITVDLNVAVHVGVNTAILGGRDTDLEKRYELSED